MPLPEKWRKKFVTGQKVWYIDHINYKVLRGTFDGYFPYNREYEENAYVKGDLFRTQVLESWIFPYGEKAQADKKLQSLVKNQIVEKEYELKLLKELLKLLN